MEAKGNMRLMCAGAFITLVYKHTLVSERRGLSVDTGWMDGFCWIIVLLMYCHVHWSVTTTLNDPSELFQKHQSTGTFCQICNYNSNQGCSQSNKSTGTFC